MKCSLSYPRLLPVFIILFYILPSFGQNNGFLITLPQVSDSVFFDAPFHTLDDAGGVIYTYHKADFSSDYKEGSRAYIVQSKADGTIVKTLDLGNDTLRSFCAYGNRVGKKIQTFTLASSASTIYMIYRLSDMSLETEETLVFPVDAFSKTSMFAFSSYIHFYKTQGAGKDYVALDIGRHNAGSGESRYIAMIFDKQGSILGHKELPLYKEITGMRYDRANDQVELIRYNSFKSVYDGDFNFIREIPVGKPVGLVNDTIYYSNWHNIVQVENKTLRLGKTVILYDINTPDESYGIEGRGVSEVDDNLHIKGRLNLTPLPIPSESEGVARYSGSLFYRDGYYYTFFEFLTGNGTSLLSNTIYVTKFDTLFNIVEETHFMMSSSYLFFTEWTDLSDDLRFSASGYFVDVSSPGVPGKVGGFILVLNADGSQPLGRQNDLIKAVVRVKGNPTSDYLTLSTDDTGSRNYEVRIYDINGHLVRVDKDWHDGEIRIPVHAQPPGTYIYQVWEAGRPLISGKFVKI